MIGRKGENKRKKEKRKKGKKEGRGKRKEGRTVPKFTFLHFSFIFVPRACQSSQKNPKQNPKGIIGLRDKCVDGVGRGRLRGKRLRRAASEKASVIGGKARSPDVSPPS